MGSLQKYKLIAIDLDGTLLSPAGRVTDRAKAAIHRCLEAKLLICFATGRNWTESQTVLDAVEHYSSAVFVGGAMIVDTRQRVQLHRTAIEPALAGELCAFLEANGLAALALQDETVTNLDYLISGDIPVNAATASWMKITNARTQFIPSLADHSHEHTIRIGAVGPSQQMNGVEKQMRALFHERVYMHAINVSQFGIDVLEIFDPSVNKWQGILHVAKLHNVQPEEIIAIGDDLNDLHMLENAGLGVAMGNARPEALAAAKMTIGRNSDDGLAAFLEELVASGCVLPDPELKEKADEAA